MAALCQAVKARNQQTTLRAPHGLPDRSFMNRLPLVQVPAGENREWIAPADIKEAFRIQQRFVYPDIFSLLWTFLLLILPSLYYLFWVLPKLLRPGEAFVDSRACMSSLIWAVASFTGLMVAACRNPGVVPRAIPSVAGKTRYVVVNSVVLKQRYCQTCRLYRPMRSKHCSLCNRCVFRFDHHCTWLGNCVGLGNYRSFIFLVAASTVFFGEAVATTCKVLHRTFRLARHGPGSALAEDALSLRQTLFSNAGKVLFAAYSVALFFALLVLVLYHIVIMSYNLTTNEHVRDYYPARNPYDAGCMANFKQIFCAPYGRPVLINAHPAKEGRPCTLAIAPPNKPAQPVSDLRASGQKCKGVEARLDAFP